jgi:MoaA/NifB/PqqE/SkfB family radical SAM enzyme
MKKRDNDFLTSLSWVFSYPLVKPEILQIDLTHRCNLDCKMCNVRQYSVEESGELSKEEVLDLLSQAKKLGVTKLVLAGGEPLLRKDVFEICGYARNINIEPVIVSNGTLIDENIVHTMMDNFNGTISISLDGLADTHDYLRGAGSFNKTLEGIKRIVVCQKQRNTKRIHLIVGLVITSYNYKDLIRMVELIADLKADGLYFVPLVRDNTDLHDTKANRSLWLKPAEINELAGILKEATAVAGDKGVNLESKIPNDFIIKYFRGEIGFREWLCYGGLKNIFVTLCNPEGKKYYQPYVRICMEFAGNVRKQKLRDIWFSSRALKARRKIKYCNSPCMQPCFPGAVPNFYQKLLSSFLRPTKQ